MAELFDPNVDFALQSAGLSRQQKLAEYLRKQADTIQAQIPTQGTMVGGRWIAPSASAGLQAGLAGYLANTADTKAQQQEAQLLQQQQEAAQRWRASLPQSTPATPGMAPNYVMESPEGQAGTPGTPFKPVPVGDRLKAAMAGMANPLIAKEAEMWNKGVAEETTREDTQQARRDQLVTQLAQQAELARQRSEDAKYTQAQQLEFKKQQLESEKALKLLALQTKVDVANIMAAARAGSHGDANAARQERAAERNADKLDKQVTDLSKQAKTVAPMIQTARAVQEMLDAYDKKPIPGIGYEAKLPGVLLPKEGVVNRAKVKGFANAMLRNQAGLSQTLSETENANLELLANGNFSEKEFRAIWPTLMDKINATTTTMTSGYLPEAVETVRKRGGIIEPVVSKRNTGSAQGGWKIEAVK